MTFSAANSQDILLEKYVARVYSAFFASATETKSHIDSYQELLDDLVRAATLWGWAHGICFLESPPSVTSVRLVPFTLIPSLFPRQCYDEAVSLCPIFTRLIAKITYQPKWLFSALHKVACADPDFTLKLLQVATRCYGDGPLQRNICEDIVLILIRSDYMVNSSFSPPRLSQVELNTISLSFGGFAEKLVNYHRTALQRLPGFQNSASEMIPSNPCHKTIVQALADAYTLYTKRHSSEILPPSTLPVRRCVLMVASSEDTNQIDQRLVEFSLLEQHIPVLRKSFKELSAVIDASENNAASYAAFYSTADPSRFVPITSTCATLLQSKGRLAFTISNVVWEICLVYYRSGYDPADYAYNPESAWRVREILEVSEAVKCPNILTHLAGVKKIQSLWGSKQQLALWLNNPDACERVSATFMDQADLLEYGNSKQVQSLVQEAIQTPDRFILKTLREGGAKHLHGAELQTVLRNSTTSNGVQKESDFSVSQSRHTLALPVYNYILMRKIEPKPSPTIVLSTSQSRPEPRSHLSVSELGTFGVYLADGTCELRCEHGGYLLRTKNSATNEGGVAIGAAFLDSPLLVD